jgi:hypothetical protein
MIARGGEREIFGKGSIAIDNPQYGAIFTVSGLTCQAIMTMAAGGVNFSDNTLIHQISWPLLDNADKFMA